MSIWGKIAGIGVAAAGAITGNPALIGTGASIFGADVASGAAKDAAATQAAAGQKSLDLQKQIYTQGQANLSPYMSAGAGAITNLRGLTGQSLTPAPASPMTAPGQFPGGHPGLFPGSTEYAPGEGPANLGMPLAAGPPAAIGAPSLNSLASQQTSSGYVTMRSPDGKSTKPVPADQVAHYQQQGAQVVS